MPEQLHMRLIRPLIRRIVERKRRRGRAAPLLERPLTDPYAGLVKAYAGSPIEAALVRTIEEMWESPILTRRCKLLMLAVIARGLGCQVFATEVEDAPAPGRPGRTGAGPSADASRRAGTRRGRASLGALRARETIWYEPAALQRRARALRDRLSEAQFIKSVGVASLANGLCRMGATVMGRA